MDGTRSNSQQPPVYDIDVGIEGLGTGGENSGDAIDRTSSDAGNDSIIEPGRIAAGDGGGSSAGRPRKRRSDAGKSRGAREKTSAADLSGLAEILSEMHSMLAFITGVPEFALDESKGEHEKLARAAERVARHYNIPALDPVTRDWIMLAKTAGIIYGSRMMHYYTRSRTASPQQAKVVRAVPQAPTPKPVEAPANKAIFAEVDVPGFGKQQVRIQ